MRRNTIKPKKHFGQNFLTNPRIKERIIESTQLKSSETILEIGAGDGRLTRLIAPHVKKVIAIEIDKSLTKNFLLPEFSKTNVEVWNGDILKYPFDSLPGPVKIIGNIPYNISTPIIEKVLSHKDKFDFFYMTVQLEFGHRLVAKPHTKKYGSLSCFVQFYTIPKLLFKIGKNSFYPAPKVDSCFVSIHAPKKPLYNVTDETFFLKITRKAFEQRRKTIHNSLARICPKEELFTELTSLNIDPKSRAENLSVEDFVKIANKLYEKR